MNKVDKEAWFDVSFKMKAHNCKEIYESICHDPNFTDSLDIKIRERRSDFFILDSLNLEIKNKFMFNGTTYRFNYKEEDDENSPVILERFCEEENVWHRVTDTEDLIAILSNPTLIKHRDLTKNDIEIIRIIKKQHPEVDSICREGNNKLSAFEGFGSSHMFYFDLSPRLLQTIQNGEEVRFDEIE